MANLNNEYTPLLQGRQDTVLSIAEREYLVNLQKNEQYKMNEANKKENFLNQMNILNSHTKQLNEIKETMNTILKDYKIHNHTEKRKIYDDYITKKSICQNNYNLRPDQIMQYEKKLIEYTKKNGVYYDKNNKLQINYIDMNNNYDYGRILELKDKKYDLLTNFENFDPDNLLDPYNWPIHPFLKKIIQLIILYIIINLIVLSVFICSLFGNDKDTYELIHTKLYDSLIIGNLAGILLIIMVVSSKLIPNRNKIMVFICEDEITKLRKYYNIIGRDLIKKYCETKNNIYKIEQHVKSCKYCKTKNNIYKTEQHIESY